MSSHTSTPSLRATPRAAFSPPNAKTNASPFSVSLKQADPCKKPGKSSHLCYASNGGNESNSYLDMWKGAVRRQRKYIEIQKILENKSDGGGGEEKKEDLEKKSEEFNKILEVSREERDRVQKMQVIDRAAAAIAAARSVLNESNGNGNGNSKSDSNYGDKRVEKEDVDESVGATGSEQDEKQNNLTLVPWRGLSKSKSQTPDHTPGPDFWSWAPPSDGNKGSDNFNGPQTAKGTAADSTASNPVKEKEQSLQFLSIPFESVRSAPLPPLQSLMETEAAEDSKTGLHNAPLGEKWDLGALFSNNAAEAARALHKVDDLSSEGVNPDGSRWWRETGVEKRPDGVVCRWTLNRGVTADQAVEWQEKYWEAADELGYKELGSEKSGRDATGNIWRENWRESMRQENGVVHLEKTADKWGKNGTGAEWQETWWEHYGGSGQAEKWAHKWCSTDPSTPLEAGHAHVWHERWGEKYDGLGGSIKYTDKWAERHEGDGWTKWGDKWDENFDLNGHGVKQGETWWQGKHGERWNRTWGEHHNGSGWLHKYGKSSSGEHWDTHVKEDTWYERFPHYGFYHCYENSVQLREVKKPSEWDES